MFFLHDSFPLLVLLHDIIQFLIPFCISLSIITLQEQHLRHQGGGHYRCWEELALDTHILSLLSGSSGQVFKKTLLTTFTDKSHIS